MLQNGLMDLEQALSRLERFLMGLEKALRGLQSAVMGFWTALMGALKNLDSVQWRVISRLGLTLISCNSDQFQT